MTATMLLLLACRPEPGAPDYPVPQGWGAGDDTASGFLPGPDPYEEGEDRLSLGIFYEGGYSEIIPVDDLTSNFYIYESSFSATDVAERIEGTYSTEMTMARDTWWGGGVTWDSARDLSAWTTIHFSALSEDLPDFEVGIVGVNEFKVLASSAGFTADGQWHTMSVPLSSFTGVDFTQVTIPLILGGESSTGQSVLIDAVYFTAE